MMFVISALFFVVCQAFFSGIETGLVSIRGSKVEMGIRDGDRAARILAAVLKRPNHMLTTCLLGTNICIVCASVSAMMAVKSMGRSGPIAMTVTAAAMTMIFLFAEIIPKNWFRQAPYERCALFAVPFHLSFLLLSPATGLFVKLTVFVNRLFNPRAADAERDPELLREDFRLLLRDSERAGVVDSKSADILDRSLDFHNFMVGQAMVPVGRVKVVAAGTSVANAMDFCQKQGVSRVPVAADNGSWIGIFSIYDAIFNIPKRDWENRLIDDCLRHLFEVGVNMRIGEFVDKVNQIAEPTPFMAVVDYQSGMRVGIVTVMDVARLLFGEE